MNESTNNCHACMLFNVSRYHWLFCWWFVKDYIKLLNKIRSHQSALRRMISFQNYINVDCDGNFIDYFDEIMPGCLFMPSRSDSPVVQKWRSSFSNLWWIWSNFNKRWLPNNNVECRSGPDSEEITRNMTNKIFIWFFVSCVLCAHFAEPKLSPFLWNL